MVAVHIDYANRKESGREADFLEDWCRDEDMVFRKRAVNEVKRGVTNREEYEEVARMARYEAYLETMKEFGCEVVLNGHHHGDVQENVISNIMRVSSLYYGSSLSLKMLSHSLCIPYNSHSFRGQVYLIWQE